MESIKFEKGDLKIAESQDEYNTIHAHHGLTVEEGWPVFTMAFKLSDEELKQIQETGVIWYQQCGNQVAPFSIHSVQPQLRDK